MDDTHVLGLMNEITHAFDHFLTRLALVGLRVKMSKCELFSLLDISSNIEIPRSCTLVTYGLCILGVLMGLRDYATHFLNEVLFHDMAHFIDLPLLGNVQVVLGILFS